MLLWAPALPILHAVLFLGYVHRRPEKGTVLYICNFNVRTAALETHLYPSVLYSKTLYIALVGPGWPDVLLSLLFCSLQ
jgi:hypothetical protein